MRCRTDQPGALALLALSVTVGLLTPSLARAQDWRYIFNGVTCQQRTDPNWRPNYQNAARLGPGWYWIGGHGEPGGVLSPGRCSDVRMWNPALFSLIDSDPRYQNCRSIFASPCNAGLPGETQSYQVGGQTFWENVHTGNACQRPSLVEQLASRRPGCTVYGAMGSRFVTDGAVYWGGTDDALRVQGLACGLLEDRDGISVWRPNARGAYVGIQYVEEGRECRRFCGYRVPFTSRPIYRPVGALYSQNEMMQMMRESQCEAPSAPRPGRFTGLLPTGPVNPEMVMFGATGVGLGGMATCYGGLNAMEGIDRAGQGDFYGGVYQAGAGGFIATEGAAFTLISGDLALTGLGYSGSGLTTVGMNVARCGPQAAACVAVAAGGYYTGRQIDNASGGRISDGAATCVCAIGDTLANVGYRWYWPGCRMNYDLTSSSASMFGESARCNVRGPAPVCGAGRVQAGGVDPPYEEGESDSGTEVLAAAACSASPRGDGATWPVSIGALFALGALARRRRQGRSGARDSGVHR